MEKYICDRVEEGTVVFEKENGEHVKVSTALLSFEISEGDVCLYDEGRYILSDEQTQKRRSKLLSLQKKISEKNKKY